MKSTRTNEFVIGWVMGLLGLLGSPPASVWGASVAIPPRDDPAWGLLDLSGVTAAQLKGRFRNPLPIWLEPWMLRTPGDPRPYRHGVHQGIDFYGVSWGTAVYPIAPGIVIRADHDYRPMSPEDRAAMLRRCAEIGATPGEWGVPPDPIWGDVLDRLRGRQVWLYHGRNEQGEPILSLYAHLSAVEAIQVGQRVDRTTPIGRVGNSGTSQEGVSKTQEVHLHLEIWIGDRYWSPRKPEERGRRLPPEREEALRRTIIQELGAAPATEDGEFSQR